MFLILDLVVYMALIRTIVWTENVLLCSSIWLVIRLLLMPTSTYAHRGFFLSVLGAALIFGVAYVYFWLLVRLPLGSFGWWAVALSLPLLRVLLEFLPMLWLLHVATANGLEEAVTV